MISNTVINKPNNYFFGLEKSRSESEKDSPIVKHYEEAQIDIDTDVSMLSSRKLWHILKLSQLKGCGLEREFLQQVQQELIIRDDFNNGEAWNDPH